MKKTVAALFAIITLAVGTAQATTYTLEEYAWNIDGTASGENYLASNFTMPLSYSTSITGTGSHFAILMLDADIDDTDDEYSNTFYNEFGLNNGLLVNEANRIQSWQIGDPWAELYDSNNDYINNIYDNVAAGGLTNSDLNSGTANDVALALGWNFTLAEQETAYLHYFFSTEAPTSGFYLEHNDPDSLASLYFYSTLDIRGGTSPEPVPEPSTIFLLGAGLAGLGLYGRKRRNRQ